MLPIFAKMEEANSVAIWQEIVLYVTKFREMTRINKNSGSLHRIGATDFNLT